MDIYQIFKEREVALRKEIDSLYMAPFFSVSCDSCATDPSFEKYIPDAHEILGVFTVWEEAEDRLLSAMTEEFGLDRAEELLSEAKAGKSNCPGLFIDFTEGVTQYQFYLSKTDTCSG